MFRSVALAGVVAAFSFTRGAAAQQLQGEIHPAGAPHLVVADIDHDGSLDVVTPAPWGAASVWLNPGSGALESIGIYGGGTGSAGGIAEGDLNGDGHMDLLLGADLNPNFLALAGDGTGAFPLSAYTAMARAPRGIVAVDFDLDGTLDAVVAQSCGRIVILKGKGSLGFSPIADTAVGNVLEGLVVADLDGEARIEVTS